MIIPTQLWTLDNALSLLRTNSQHESLEEFLMLHRDVLQDPQPFSSTSEPIKDQTKEILVHNITYTLENNNVADARKVHELLGLDLREIARVVSQTSRRIPEKKISDLSKLKSKLPDERQRNAENERLYLYASRVLRERRTVLQLVVELLFNMGNENASSAVRNLGREIFLSRSYLPGLIAGLAQAAQALVDKRGTGKMDELVQNETKLFMIETCRVIVELLPSRSLVGEEIVAWFDLMDETRFFVAYGPHFAEQAYALLSGLATVISVQFLDLDRAYPNKSPVCSAGVFEKVHQVVVANENVVLRYSWSIVLLRQHYYNEANPENEVAKKLLVKHEAIVALSETCTSVYDELVRLNELLAFDNIYAAVLSTVVVAAMPLVDTTPTISRTVQKVLQLCPNAVVERFFDNEATTAQIVLARAKFPLSVTPYLRLAGINGNFAMHEFSELRSVMARFAKDEFYHMYEIDVDNTDLVRTTRSIDIKPPYDTRVSMVLPAGTRAKILPAARDDEVLVTFLHTYSGWAFLGRILQNVSRLFQATDTDKVDTVVEILGLVAQVCDGSSSEDDVRTVLEAMSLYTDNCDIVEVMFRLLEQGLHAREMRVLEAALGVLTHLFGLVSARVWPFLAKSALLARNGKEGLAAIVFGAIEMVNGEYPFTVALIKFVDAMVASCLAGDEYPSKPKGELVRGFVEHLLHVFESFVHCRFDRAAQKMEIGVLLLDVFTRVLQVFGVGYMDECVGAVLEAFLDPRDSRTAVPIIAMADSLAGLSPMSDLSGFWHENWVRAALAFSTLVITLRTRAQRPPSALEQKLFAKLPVLVHIYSVHNNLRREVMELLAALTSGSWTDKPSLLAHLGRDSAQVLLHSVCADLGNSFDDHRIKIALYSFLCSVLENNQEGLAVLFISGRDVFDDEEVPSLLPILKRNVREIHKDKRTGIYLLDTLALAYSMWSRDGDDDFLDELAKYIKEKGEEGDDKQHENASILSLLNFGKIAEILALVLFISKKETTRNKIVGLLTEQEFLDTVQRKFVLDEVEPMSSELKLIKSEIVPRHSVGPAAVYNLPLMEQMYQKDPRWPDLNNRVARASLSAQHAEAQRLVAKSMAALLTAFCRRCPDKLSAMHLTLVPHLLRSTLADTGEDLFSVRLELAFYIMYSLYKRSDVVKDRAVLVEILTISLQLLRTERVQYYAALAASQGYYRPVLRIIHCCLGLVQEDVELLIEHHGVLRDLFDIVITKSAKVLLIEVQNDVYRAHADRTRSAHMNPKIDDLMLVLSILKIFVGMQTSRDLAAQMSAMVTDNGTIRALIHTFSLAHHIQANDDYILAQIALMFVQQLMSIELIAHKFVRSALFLALVESPVSAPIRDGGVGVQNSPQHHRIWNNGILPVVIIALSKLGPSVLPDVCVTLRLFSKQIAYCIANWSRDSQSIQINTAIVAETAQILLINDLLAAMNVSEYLEGRELDFLPGLETPQKRDEFAECVSNLLKHPKFLASRVTASSAEEERVIEKGGLDGLVGGVIEDIGGFVGGVI